MQTDTARDLPAASRHTRLAWYAYDLGNTTVEFAIPLYLTLWIVNDLGVPAWAYGVASAISSWAIGLSGPYIGVSADDRHMRRQWFVFSSLTSTVLLGSLAFLPHSGTAAIVALIAIAMAANYLFQLSSLIYNASLSGAASGSNVVTVSSVGLGLSFLGGMIGIGLIELLVSGRVIPGVSGRGVAIAPAALLYVVCAVPSMLTAGLWRYTSPEASLATAGLHRRIVRLWKEAGRERRADWFLGGFFFLNSAIMGLTLYLPLHVETVTDLEGRNLLLVFGGVVIASALGAGIVAFLRPTGPAVRRVILVGLVLLAVNTFVFSLMKSPPLVVVCSCLHGMFSGGLASTVRGAFAQTFRSDYQALAFGLYGAVQRVSQGLGAVLWPLVGAGVGSYASRLGVAAMGVLVLIAIPFFVRWRFLTVGTGPGSSVPLGEQA
jgi:MFS-type transporter involved in bile tolerance (Atg22 family)